MQSPPSELPPHSDQVDEEVRRIELALDAVFSPTHLSVDASRQSAQWWEQRQLADRYLTSFQGTSISWMVCDRLLSAEGGDPGQQQQRKFFAAQTLHTKCRLDVMQLNASDLPSLRDSLLNHLTRISSLKGSTALTTRLAMCISALAVQMGWTTIVTDLLQQGEAIQNRLVCMQLLKVLPEECASDRLVLPDENVRYYMRDHLVTSSAMVFSFLQQSAGSTQIYEVFHTWIRYVPVHATVLLETPLVEASVNALVSQHIEIAVDVIVEILRMYPSHNPANQGLVQKMIPLLSKLPLDQAFQSGDEDLLRAYCRIVTEMGESYMSLLLSPQENHASKLVEWILKCSGIPDSEIASITLHFWYRMVLDLECIEPYDVRQDLVDRYTPHLLELINVCTTNLLKYPNDLDELTEDRVDDLHRDRFYVSETIEDCCRLLGGHTVLHRVGRLLQNECRRVEAKLQSDWQGIESCLTCILCCHKFIASDEAEFLPFVFEMIPRLPQEIIPLRTTASKTIGKYASWLAAHPELLQPLLPYLSQGLSIQPCSTAAAVSIKELCECSNQQVAMAEPVLHLYNEITSELGRLDLKDELEVLEGVCRAVSRQIQDTRANASTFVHRIVQPIGSRLSTSVADPNVNPKQRILPEIDRLTVIVRFVTVPAPPNQPHPIVELIQSSWSLLDGASNRFPHDNALAEKICRLHKHALRKVGAAAYAPMLDALMEQLVRSYERSRQSPFLYAASICVSEYGREAAYGPKLFEMISAMATASFSFLRNLEDLTAHPDVVEELFYLMGRMMNHCPDPLVQSPLLQSLFQCAAVGMKLDHRDANKGTLNFLENAVSYGLSLREKNKPECQVALENVLTSEGQGIVNNLAGALLGELPAYSVDSGNGSIAGILWKLNLLCPGLLAQWLSVALVNAPERARSDFMGGLGSGYAREDFFIGVRALLSASDRHRKLQRMLSK